MLISLKADQGASLGHFIAIVFPIHGISLSQPCTMMWFFLVCDPAEFCEGVFQHFMLYYEDEMTKQHFTCREHYCGQVCILSVERLVNLDHACWCLSVLWNAIPEPD